MRIKKENKSSSIYSMMEYPSGGGVGDLLPNTFAQVSPLSLNSSGVASRTDSEVKPGIGLTLGKNKIGGQTMKNEGFDVSGTANLNIPYSGEKPSVYGDLRFGADPFQLAPGRGVEAQAYGKIGAGYDPNLGFNTAITGGADFLFRNMSSSVYNRDKWKQGAWQASVGPEAGPYFRSKALETPSGYEGSSQDVKAGMTYGGKGSFEVQPFKLPLRLKAEGSLMYNPGAGKTVEGENELGKIQGQWRPGLQVSAKMPLSAFSKPKRVALKKPIEKNDPNEGGEFVRETPSTTSPNAGITTGRMDKSLWRTN